LEETTGVVDVDDIPIVETEYIIPTRIKEEIAKEEASKVNQAAQGQNPRTKANPTT
jgi:hypothetical protein